MWEAAGVVIAGLALIWSVVGYMLNRRRAGDAVSRAAEAERTAERSADAAERSAAAQERMAETWSDMLSAQEKRDRAQWSRMLRQASRPRNGPGPFEFALDDPGPRPVHWTVDRVRDRLFTLRNLSLQTARDVRITAENVVRFDGPEDGVDIGPGSEVPFSAFSAWGSGIPELVVHWLDDSSDEPHEWRRVLP